MSEHNHLSVPSCNSKNCKIAQHCGRFLQSSVSYRPRPEGCHQAGCAHIRPSLASWSHMASTEFMSGEWVGQGSIRSMLCFRPKTDRQLRRDEDVRYRSWRWCSDASPRMAQQRVGERHRCTVPHSSLSSTCVVKSVDNLTSCDLWHY